MGYEELAAAILESTVSDFKNSEGFFQQKTAILAYKYKDKPPKYTLRKLEIKGVVPTYLRRNVAIRTIANSRKRKTKPKLTAPFDELSYKDMKSATSFVKTKSFAALCDFIGLSAYAVRKKLGVCMDSGSFSTTPAHHPKNSDPQAS